MQYKAFSNCHSPTKVEMSENITEIGVDAFSLCCNLEEIKLPVKLRHLCDGSFGDTGI